MKNLDESRKEYHAKKFWSNEESIKYIELLEQKNKQLEDEKVELIDLINRIAIANGIDPEKLDILKHS